MLEDMSKTISPHERLSYESLLLQNILDCSRLRWKDQTSFIICVDTLRNLLIGPLREEVKSQLKNNKEYLNYIDKIKLLRTIMESDLENFEEINKLKEMAKKIGFNNILYRLESYEKDYRNYLKQKEVMKRKDRYYLSSSSISKYNLDNFSLEQEILTYNILCRDIVLRTIIDVLDNHGLLLRYESLRIGVPSANSSGSNKEGL